MLSIARTLPPPRDHFPFIYRLFTTLLLLLLLLSFTCPANPFSFYDHGFTISLISQINFHKFHDLLFLPFLSHRGSFENSRNSSFFSFSPLSFQGRDVIETRQNYSRYRHLIRNVQHFYACIIIIKLCCTTRSSGQR